MDSVQILIITAGANTSVTSYLAANLLERAAHQLDWQVQLECYSPLVALQEFSAEQIANADVILVASDRPLDLSRFDGKALYQGDLLSALKDPQTWLQQAKAQAQIYTHAPVPIVVAVTACPTGVAHTFMAANALQEAATNMGVSLWVETQGALGKKNPLTSAQVAQATVVIVAADIEVDKSRFVGKRLYRTNTRQALRQPQQIIEQALAQSTLYLPHTQQSAIDPFVDEGVSTFSSASQNTANSAAHQAYQHLLTGVSFMLPLVVAGGLLIALSLVFGIDAQSGTLADALQQIGIAAFALMIPLLSGYIAYSMAGRSGLAPGMIGGMLASTLDAGFIGGIASGFIAGYSVRLLLHHLTLPTNLAALKPVLIIPLLASLITGLLMTYIVGGPVAWLMSALTDFLNSLGAVNALLLGALLGAMMGFDMGGPVNKAAYAFAVGLLTAHNYGPMAAAMAAGMVPALGMGLATLLARYKFTLSEREAGKAAWVLGLCFISEGAIPFAAKDPLRVIPATLVGGAVAGALAMGWGAKLVAPHGGIFVFFIPYAIEPMLGYAIAIASGTLVTGGMYAVLKRAHSHYYS